MNMEDIRKNWVKKKRDIRFDIEMWDAQSGDPVYAGTYDRFLELLETEQMLCEEGDVLDVGCGAGAYSLALCGKVRSVVGTDLSPKMLARAEKIAEEQQANNAGFLLLDWNEVDLERQGWNERFHLVFAHNTPAICDVATFEKLNAASNRFCAVCAPIFVNEPVMDQVRKVIGEESSHEDEGNSLTYMLGILLQKGYKPKIHYEDQTWPMKQSFDEACAYYIGKIRMSRDLSEQDIDAIRSYLKTILKDGTVTDTIRTTTAAVYWEKL